jgi:aminoglycoside phosphotransferase family enzyme/predicted kinase
MSELVRDLSQVGAYPSQPREVKLVETHVSWVFLVGPDVYKVKKPVSLGFLDFSTIERRRLACTAEVALNARLSPEVYLGVVPIVRDPQGRHRVDGAGSVVDWAVHMRRMPDADRGDERLARGALGAAEIDRLAAQIAAFHAAAAHGAEVAAGTTDVVAALVGQNFAQTRPDITRYLARAEADEIEAWQRGVLTVRADAFAQRMADGRIRDGHGDLRLDQLYLSDDGKVTILDCIEFDERFRHGDVCADIAFLAMDLAWRGRVDLSELLLARYARHADDYDLYTLVDFYQSYRAWVRGKIAALMARDAAATEAQRELAEAQARRYFLLALSAHRPPLRKPRVVAVGGLIASGKSTVADLIGLALPAAVVDSDRTRKHMLGLEATTPVHDQAWANGYDLAFTGRVYDEVLRRAAVVLASGRPVVLDASFRSAEMRQRARELATRFGVPFLLVECRATPEVCRQRLVARAGAPTVSDGRLAIFDAFAARFEPVQELPPSEHVVLDTTVPRSDLLAQLARWFE